MAIDTLTASLGVICNWTAKKASTGSDYGPIQNTSTINKAISLGTSVANSAAGGSDELASKIYSLVGAASTTIDLTALVDILNQTGVSLARVKGVLIRLLSTADDASNGSAASYVTIGNNGTNDWISQAGGRGWLASATSVFDIPNGGHLTFGVGNGAGVAVDGTHKIIKVTNGDAVVTAKVQVSLIGGST